MSLKDIKLKIKSVDRTRKVTKAMEAVSAVKMRKSQVRAISGRPYARAALAVLERLAPSLSTVKHPLTITRPIKRAAIVVVTSDKGLCGVLNAAVIKEAAHLATNYNLRTSDIDIYAYGKKGAEYFDRRGYPLKQRFDTVSDDISIDDLEVVSRSLTAGFMEGAYDRVDIVFTNFRSTFEQKAIAHQVLPLALETIEEMVAGITPDKGTFATHEKIVAPAALPSSGPSAYTVEPEPEEVLETLLPRLTSVVIYHALLESKASEHSARMVAMKNASDKSRDLSKALTRKFNKARQAAITREVSEIVGGIEAMASA
jgi:F-type H+-transporting ATPase subunit gamma